VKIEINLPLKALSQNNIERSASVNHRYKTKEAVLFARETSSHIGNHEEVAAFVGHFDKEIHAIILTLTFYFKHNAFFTAKNKGNRRISNRVGDCTNFVKYSEDVIFRALGIDDRYVFSCHSRKLPSQNDRILATLEIVPLKDIPEFTEFLSI